jgi:PAS domain S-box-containing protein
MVVSGEVAIGRLDLDGRILYVNDCARRLWGTSLEEVLRGNFIDRVVPEDRAQAQQAFREVIETGIAGDVLLRFDTPAGPRYCINALAPIKNSLGAPETLQLTIMDITSVVEGQQPAPEPGHEYSSIAEVAENAVIRMDRKGKCTFSNDYASTLLDTSAEDLFESIFGDSLLAPDKDTVRERLRRTFETGEPERGLLTTHLLKGEQRILLTRWEPIRENRREKIEEIQLTIVDTTEHIYAERRRAQSERLEALTKMARGLAHEVNNTLAAVMLWGNVALTKNENADVRGALERALEAAQSGAETMKRIQRFAEPGDPGRHDLLNLNEIAADCVLFTRPHWKDQSEARDIYITVEEDLDETVVVRGNAAELREAVVNLITNAIEAMPNGGTLAVKTFKRGESAYLTVSDTGGGIQREDIAHIFAPFYTTRPEGGRGLGLSVAENIVKLHGGEVQVESQNKKGSAFTIVLPRADSKSN